MKKLRYHLILIIGFFLTMLLTGCFCTQKVEVLPKSLPNATLGTPYYAEIEVYNSRVINDSFHYLITPENSGLEISPAGFGTHVSFNDLKVKGTPKVAGKIAIKFAGLTYGTMCPGSKFIKTYSIKVEE